jgi:hypothetical protein
VQCACAEELLRHLPSLVTLLRTAAADARQRPALVDLCAAPSAVVAHVAVLVCEQSGIRSVAEASEWAVATEAALGLLPLLDELHAGWDAPSSPSESPPLVGVTKVDTADMAFNIVSGLLDGGLSSATMLWSGPDMQRRAEEAARTGAFDALMRLHARVCCLAFWLPARSSPRLLPDECLQLPQDTLQELFLLMWDISCCAEEGAVEGGERRRGRCEGFWRACGGLHPTLAALRTASLPSLLRSLSPSSPPRLPDARRREAIRAALSPHFAALHQCAATGVTWAREEGAAPQPPNSSVDSMLAVVTAAACCFPRLFRASPLLEEQLALLASHLESETEVLRRRCGGLLLT